VPRYLPRILRSGPRDELVIIPATLVGSAATADLQEVDQARAAELVRAAADGGLWVVAGTSFARVLTAVQHLHGGFDLLPERDAPLLFDGAAPRAFVGDGFEPVELLVPVAGWEAPHSFYFHSEASYFKHVPVVRKRNHRLEVERGEVDDETRKLARRRVLEGQRCGLLRNELGGITVVPDGEVAVDVRALYGERFRFILDGLRDLDAAASALLRYADQFRDAADCGWVLERAIDNSFVYAVNRRRLRTQLPLPATGALVPVGPAVAVVDDVTEVTDAELVDPVPPGNPLVVPALSVSAELLELQPLALPAGPEPRPLADALIDHFVDQLLSAAPDIIGSGRRGAAEVGMPVLRATTFRRPRGRLMRADSPSRMVEAVVEIDRAGTRVLRGALRAEANELLKATIEEDPELHGTFGVCEGAFGSVLAEVGSPMRAVQSMTSSTSYAHLLDGVTRLEDAATRLQHVAHQLERLAAEGWTLAQPIAGFWLRLRPPQSRPL